MAKNLEIFTANLKALNVNDPEVVKEGEKISIQLKEIGMSDIFPQVLIHPMISLLISISNY